MSFDTKSLLAKLMATENLTVEQRKVSTASFDVKNRILTIPILDEKMSTQLYDLFMGHEVGHALYTPLEGMQKAKDENMNMSILNVVEDARIERKIKYKYPGLKNSFIRAYRELMERDFFETLGKDLNALNFIDKANMHFKGGADLTIRFSEFERELIDAIDSTETYEDVVDVAKRITDYMKEQQQEQNITEINMNVDISDLDLENLEIINEPRQQMGSTTEENSESSSENESSGESEKKSEEKINAGSAGSNSSDEKGEEDNPFLRHAFLLALEENCILMARNTEGLMVRITSSLRRLMIFGCLTNTAISSGWVMGVILLDKSKFEGIIIGG